MTYPAYPHITDKKPQPAHTIEAVKVYYMAELTKYFHADDVVQAVHGKIRKDNIVLIRHCFRWLMYRHFNTLEIGRKFKCDHTTALHSINYVNDKLPVQNKKLHKQISNIPKP